MDCGITNYTVVLRDGCVTSIASNHFGDDQRKDH